MLCPVGVLSLPIQIGDRFGAVMNNMERLDNASLLQRVLRQENVILIIFGQQHHSDVAISKFSAKPRLRRGRYTPHQLGVITHLTNRWVIRIK